MLGGRYFKKIEREKRKEEEEVIISALFEEDTMRTNRHRKEVLEEGVSELPPMSSEDVAKVEETLGYTFNDKKLLWEALTHPSVYYPYKSGVTYERLEYIGDAVLNCNVAHWLFTLYPDLAPGPLTRLRAANVDTEKLARVAIAGDLHKFIRHKAPQLGDQWHIQIEEFSNAIKDYPDHSYGLLDPPKVLADVVESVLGAIFMDSNGSTQLVWEAFRRLAEPLIDMEKLGRHPVTELHEFCQKKKLDLKFIKDEWEQNMYIKVLINGILVGRATYGNKKDVAMNRAAKSALDRLKEYDDLLDLINSTSYFYRFMRRSSIGPRLTKVWRKLPTLGWILGSLFIAVFIHMLLILSRNECS